MPNVNLVSFKVGQYLFGHSKNQLKNQQYKFDHDLCLIIQCMSVQLQTSNMGFMDVEPNSPAFKT